MRFPYVTMLGLGFALTTGFVLGCSAGSSSSGATGADGGPASNPSTDPGLVAPDGGTTTVENRNTNPYGAAYPASNQGLNPRRGSLAGNVIRNYKFLGYPNGDKSKGIQTIALADFFDPDVKTFKLLHMSVAGVWCGPCNQETAATVPLVPELQKSGVVFFQALGDGPSLGTGATKSDLDGWVNKYKINFNIVLDPDTRQLGPFFDRAAIPWNANIDPRSMEILSAGVGYNGDITGEVNEWLSWVANNKATTF